MLYQITSFLLDVVVGLFSGACLLRVYMQYQRIPFNNPMGQIVFALSDWLVMPIRRIVRSVGRWDMASLLVAYALALLKFLLLWVVASAAWNPLMPPAMAVFDLLRTALYGLMALLLINMVLSWVQAQPGMGYVVQRLCEPPLRPFRRLIPMLNGLDLSPLVLVVVLQILAMLLIKLQEWVLIALYNITV